MKLFKEINSIHQFLASEKRENKQIGFVPTMGALHNGHLSLIKKSKAENELTVCSIFINPTQFNNKEDLEKYPRTIENDIKLLIESGCDVLFHPEVNEIYTENETPQTGNYGNLTHVLEGKFRPGHFDGVITIVKKLFQIVEPDNVYFGQKDFQQCAVINEMIVRNHFKLKMNICNTMREIDGLAMSSRNIRLTKDERIAAKAIPSTLHYIKNNIEKVSITEVLQTATKQLLSSSDLIKIEYLEIVNAITLEQMDQFDIETPAVALIAAYCGNVRLIDNIILTD